MISKLQDNKTDEFNISPFTTPVVTGSRIFTFAFIVAFVCPSVALVVLNILVFTET